mmetsp:Transcript_73245/g.196577  ORF Transcript_73245/g.196577 Transcript_73245/m.196577 type:complete len:233 (-) Transcript_73245:266-964(-)
MGQVSSTCVGWRSAESDAAVPLGGDGQSNLIDLGMCVGWRTAESDAPAPMLGDAQPNLTALSRVIEDMQRQMERQSRDNLEQKAIIGSLHSEIGCLRRRIAERDCDVASTASTSDDWARADALELDCREVDKARQSRTLGETQPIPELSSLASEPTEGEGAERAERPAPSLKPAVLEHSPRRAPTPCRAPDPSPEASPRPPPSARGAPRAQEQGKRVWTSAQHRVSARDVRH